MKISINEELDFDNRHHIMWATTIARMRWFNTEDLTKVSSFVEDIAEKNRNSRDRPRRREGEDSFYRR